MKTTESSASGLLLSRCVLGDREDMPAPVAEWMAQHAHLPDEHQKRVRELYDRQMDEMITDDERAELDHYSEIIAAIDILRAKARLILKKAA
jgi:hypothetical protein